MIKSYEFTPRTPRAVGSWGLGSDLTLAACSTPQTWSAKHWAQISAALCELKEEA